jgi:hypothetical protein
MKEMRMDPAAEPDWLSRRNLVFGLPAGCAGEALL